MSTSTRAGNWLIRAVGSGGSPRSLDAAATLGALYVAAAIVSSLLVATPGVGTSDAALMLASAFVALAGGAALWRFRPSLGQPLIFAAIALGTTWMGADAYALSTSGVFLCVWFAPSAFALLAIEPAFVASAYAIAVPGIIFASTGELTVRVGSGTAAKEWIIVAALILAASAAVYAFCRRSTERDRTLASIASELNIGIAAIGDERRVLAANPVLGRMLERDPDEIIGRQVESFTSSERALEIRSTIDALLQGAIDSAALDFPVRRSQGDALYALLHAASIAPSPSEPRSVIALVYDLSERRRIDEQRAELASLLVSAQEDERRRIASEVHDDPLQALIALGLELQILERRTKEQQVLASIDDLKDAVKQAIEQLRGVLFELHPPGLELGGLADSLRELIRRYEASGGPKVTFEDAIATDPTPEEAVALFRITSEALTNVRKHANATHVSVSLVDSQGGIALSIVDDGVGMVGDASIVVPGHFGVASMRARAARAGGNLEITSRPGNGTTVLAWIPRQESSPA